MMFVIATSTFPISTGGFLSPERTCCTPSMATRPQPIAIANKTRDFIFICGAPGSPRGEQHSQVGPTALRFAAGSKPGRRPQAAATKDPGFGPLVTAPEPHHLLHRHRSGKTFSL